MNAIVRRFLVIGKVQGVYFRHGARLEAKRLGLRGSAHNLPDGSVEVWALGSAAAVAELQQWLRRGPAQARVDAVQEVAFGDAGNGEIPAGFEVF